MFEKKNKKISQKTLFIIIIGNIIILKFLFVF